MLHRKRYGKTPCKPREAEQQHQLVAQLSSSTPAALLFLLLPSNISASQGEAHTSLPRYLTADVEKSELPYLLRAPEAKSNFITRQKLPPKRSAARPGAHVVSLKGTFKRKKKAVYPKNSGAC